MLREALRTALILAIAISALLLVVKRSDEPTYDCMTVNGDGRAYRILVVGESWAAGGKFFPELPRTVSERLRGRKVEACSIGFSGRNSRLLYHELREKFPTEKLYGLYGEKRPDKVILMTGVNDEIQHVGAPAYVEYTKKLVEYFSEVDNVEVISLPRVDERNYRCPSIYSGVKRFILKCLYDNCDILVNDFYRAALWRDHPELNMIEYDNFIDQYEGNEGCYKKDGIHLTDECLHRYGQFIGSATSIRNAGIEGR